MKQYKARSEKWVASTRATSLPQIVTPGQAKRDQVFSFYLSDYFPRMMERTCDIDVSQYIIKGICALPRKSPMLEKAFSALSCVFLGSVHKDEHMLQHGVSLYNQAIQHLANAINRSSYSDDVVYTCVIFQQIQVLAGFMFLSEETIAWLKEPNEGGLWFEYIELLTEISRITAAINRTDVSDHSTFKSLLDDCLALEQIHINFWAQIGGEPSTYARGELITAIPSTDDLFGPAYRFSSLNDAILHTLFWLSLSFVNPLLHQCRSRVAAGSSDSNQGDDDQEEAHNLSISHVAKALRCLPYCGQEGMNSWGIFYGVLAATQASRVYAHAKDWERFLWSQNIFTHLERVGFDNAARVHEIWWDYWFQANKQDPYRVLSYRESDKAY
ncbi:hypothetical protein N7462_010512 [Penicillium macrosclerotiorum]|uniref:uncharacterized protein n=1 Tax=Penicillium macrosclerotiorum TaxID=303699 RepID=UPI0025480277|nr:uncharacterized protein N7462_010512 [Penicillium macrosclerotiorum]KAJ5669442.1 hypothetical protein N7462_010512 [Penicillium macrosclerotiorum]